MKITYKVINAATKQVLYRNASRSFAMNIFDELCRFDATKNYSVISQQFADNGSIIKQIVFKN